MSKSFSAAMVLILAFVAIASFTFSDWLVNISPPEEEPTSASPDPPRSDLSETRQGAPPPHNRTGPSLGTSLRPSRLEGSRLVARVLGAAPATTVHATLTRSGSEAPLDSRALDEGHLDLGVPSGFSFTLSLTAEQRAPVHYSVPTLIPGETFDLGEITLENGRSVQGMVAKADGTPSSDCRIHIRDPQDRAIATVRCDTQGQYRVDNLPSGPLVWIFDAPDAPAITYDARQDGSDPPNEVRLSNSAALGGTVRDSRGSPISGAKVQARERSAGPRCLAETTTDEAGLFKFDRLIDGFYNLEVRAPGHRRDIKTNVSTGNHPIHVRLAKAASLTGRVVAKSDGVALPTFEVLVFDTRAGGSRLVRRTYFENAIDGFTLNELPAGEVMIEIRAPQHAPTQVRDGLEGGRTRELGLIELSNGATLRGRIVDANSGRGLKGWVTSVHAGRSQVSRDAEPHIRVASQETTSREDGSFQLDGLPEGELRLLVRAAGMAPILSDVIDVTQIQDLSGSPLRLEPGASLSGVIRGLRKRASATLELSDVVHGSSYSVKPDARGSFEFRDLPAGTYQLNAWILDPAAADLALDPNHQQTLRLKAGETRNLTVDL